jgi:hypothetical protein
MPIPLLLAAALGCAAAEPPRVEIELTQNQPATRRDLNVLQLSRRRAGVQAPALVPKRTIGLTEAQMRVVTRLTTETVRGDGGVCLRPSLVRVELRIESTVFIARELVNKPCHSEQVLLHENEHVAIDRRFAQASIADYRRVAEENLAAAATTDPIAPGEVAGATNRMRASLSEALHRVTEKLYQDRKTAQAALDTPEEYARLAAVCGPKL